MNAGHFTNPPTTGVNAILSALSALQFANGGAGHGGSGCVKTIKRIASDKASDLAAIDSMTVGNLPAMLVAQPGGPFKPFDTTGRLHEQTFRFSVICCAGKYSSFLDRLTSSAPTVDPGIEDLLDWATYLGCRALAGPGDVRGAVATRIYKKVRPVDHRWLRWETERFVAVAELEGCRFLDYHDDDLLTVLQKIGIVHDPTDPAHLFEADNTTPKTVDPATLRGGVVTL